MIKIKWDHDVVPKSGMLFRLLQQTGGANGRWEWEIETIKDNEFNDLQAENKKLKADLNKETARLNNMEELHTAAVLQGREHRARIKELEDRLDTAENWLVLCPECKGSGEAKQPENLARLYTLTAFWDGKENVLWERNATCPRCHGEGVLKKALCS